jgi:mannose-6-phosphate isomerase-like protein (cupin superfamily)
MENLIVGNARWIKIEPIKDGFDGTISVAEELKSIPFMIKRVYYIYNLMNHESVMRGKHAHRTLEQVLFCISGSCSVVLNDGANIQTVEVSDPNKGLYLGPRLWHVMNNFRNNCILLVMASDYFNEEDYIRNFDEFVEYLKQNPL